ncbi:MAG: YfiR family protein [Candidatus Eisenbacteria bacterium]|nr:YfiR family protein [Candidatus Eisenbacteria bacterium]MBU1949362.1 YfiR family protein [Candidatus Eisenbacteria bacterium]
MTFDTAKGRWICLILAALLMLAGGSVIASEEQEIPENLQVPILFKLLTYDRTLMEKSSEFLRVGVLYRRGDGASEQNMEALMEVLSSMAEKTIKGKTFEVVPIPWDRKESIDEGLRSAEVDILYVTRAHKGRLSQITALTRELNILSLTGVVDYVSGGLGVGVGLEEDHPRIMVNLDAVRAEGHDLESQVLRICKKIQSHRE